MSSGLEYGHRYQPAPGLTSAVASGALACSHLLWARRAEMDGSLDLAADRFRDALEVADRVPGFLLHHAIVSGAVAGLLRIQPDALIETRREDAIAWLASKPEATREATDIGDLVSLLPPGDPRGTQPAQRIVTLEPLPVWMWIREADQRHGEGLVVDGDRAVRHALRAPNQPHVWELAGLSGLPDIERAQCLVIAAALHLEKSEYERALERAQDAISLTPEGVEARLVLAEAKRLTGEVEDAVAILELLATVLARDDALWPMAMRALALALESDGRRRDALDVITQALGLGADPADLVFAGRLSDALGDGDVADKHFERALEQRPSDWSTVYAVVTHRLQRHELERAAHAVNAAIDVLQPWLTVLRGYVRSRQGAPGAPGDDLAAAGAPAAGSWGLVAELRLFDGDPAGALDALNLALDAGAPDVPAHVGLLLRSAHLLVELGDLQTALDRTKGAIQLDSGQCEAFRLVGEISSLQGAHSAAADAYQSWIQCIGPNATEHALALALRGEALLLCGEVSRAEDDLRKALAEDPMKAAAARDLLVLLTARDGMPAAIAAVRAVLNPRAARPLAQMLLVSNPDTALGFVDAALEDEGLDPCGRAALLAIKSAALQELGRPDFARAAAEEAIGLCEQDALAHAIYAQILTHADAARARLEAMRATELDPGSEEIVSRAVRVLIEIGFEGEALQELDSAIHQIGKEPQLLEMRARIMLDSGIDDALGDVLDQIAEARRIGPPTEELYVMEGTALRRLGRPQEALDVLSRLGPPQGSSLAIRCERAAANLQLGLPDEVPVLLHDIDSDDPLGPWALYLRAKAKRSRDDSSLIEDLSQALELDPKYADARSELVEYCAEHGDTELADQHLQVLIDDPEQRLNPEIARLAWLLEDTDLAMTRLDAILATSEAVPPEVWLYRAMILTQGGEFDEALEAARRAVDLDPDATYPRVVKSWIYRQRGESDAALRELAGLDDEAAAEERVAILLELDRSGEAIHEAESLLAGLRYGLIGDTTVRTVAGSFIANARPSDAIRLILGRMAGVPTAPLLHAAGDALSAAGEFDIAVNSYEAARRIDHATAIDSDLAWAYLMCDPPRPQDALDACDRALAGSLEEREYLLVAKADALWALARTSPGGRPEAQTLYEEVLAIVTAKSQAAEELALAGWCHYRLRQFEDAIDYLLRAVSASRAGAAARRFDLGLALLSSDLPGRAMREYNAGLFEVRHLLDPLGRRGVLRVALSDLREAHLEQTKTTTLEGAPTTLEGLFTAAISTTNPDSQEFAALIRRVDLAFNPMAASSESEFGATSGSGGRPSSSSGRESNGGFRGSSQ